MLRLTQALRGYDVTLVAADTDTTSQAKFEASSALRGPWIRIPRAREVHQPWASTVLTAWGALVASVRVVATTRPDLVLANGPGTCVPICLVARFAGARLIFCESWCRVRDLSVTGKILYPISSRFIVHWPSLLRKYPKAEYLGRIC
ncbi:hypothetical protein CTAYLR_004285 [Chrysophaeum taylorii]|uniref:UDP-N-acetylglucosamine transferase subunit ALG14 n=1 Tax=Chrysophaeum taylorii TaxID=2483200 RepID=A0AAD7XPD4_9STRA|nr:hypothetical protein CTAYLR_004285 [Chrysophaeum taylorii]